MDTNEAKAQSPLTRRLPADLATPEQKMADDRVVVTLHMIECRHCNWTSVLSEDQEAVYDSHNRHNAEKRSHTEFWHYTVQRGQGHIMWLPDFGDKKPARHDKKRNS